MFADNERFENLKEFCRVNLKAIKPKLVIASGMLFPLYIFYLNLINKIYFLGDLTDAIDYDRIKVKQFEEEWKMYKEFYTLCKKESGVTDWFDLRGNHGNNLKH